MKTRILCLLMPLLLVLTLFPIPAFAHDELKNTDPDKYYILLDTKNQVVTVFERDGAGQYTRIVRRFLCSSGKTEPEDPLDPEDIGTPTPRGKWKIGGRERFGKFANFSGEYARYWTQIVGSVYFHSLLFGARNINAMKSNPFHRIGHNVSHGCVRLYVEDAKWLYYYACPGTVIFVSNTEPYNPKLTRALKSELSFREYNALQKGFYDEPEAPNLTAWTVRKNADIRSGNGTNDHRVAKLPLDTPVEVLQYGDPWCKVRYNKREGYIRTAYLTFEEGTLESSPDADILRDTTYLRAEPEEKTTLLFKVPALTSVKVLEADVAGYTKVEVWHTTGYLPKKALTKGWGLLLDSG